MARASRRTKRRTNRKKNRSIKRSIKRDLEKSLRKTIERSIKKSLNKFNKRIKKYKKKKTKKKIQRGGSAAAGLIRPTGQASAPTGPVATEGDPNAVINPIITSLHEKYDSMFDNLNHIIEGCTEGEGKLQEVPEDLEAAAVQRVIKKTYRNVLDKLIDRTGVTKKQDYKEAIKQYFEKNYQYNKGIAKQAYLNEDGFNIFICDLYIIYELFNDDNQIIQREINEAHEAHDAAAAAAASAAADDAAREAAERSKQEAIQRINEAIKIQVAFRRWIERRKEALKAATAIQAAYRGHAVRKELGEQPRQNPARAGGEPAPAPAVDAPTPAQQPEQEAVEGQPGQDPPDPAPAPAPAVGEPAPAAEPGQQSVAPQPSCSPDPESISKIRKRILECDEKLSKCNEEKDALNKKLRETRLRIFRIAGKSGKGGNSLEELTKQLAICEEKLEKCEEEKQALEAQIKELKRREQDLLKSILCSLLAEIRINKLVEKVDGIYVDNDTPVGEELKRRLKLPGEGDERGLFDVGFKYGNLIVMLVTACVLAGVIARGEAIDILESEGLLDMNLWLSNNGEYADYYLNSLRIIVEGGTSVEYRNFRQELSDRQVQGQVEGQAPPAASSPAEAGPAEAEPAASPAAAPAVAPAVEQDPAAVEPAASPPAAVEPAADTPAAAPAAASADAATPRPPQPEPEPEPLVT
jgi:hypothetical protein